MPAVIHGGYYPALGKHKRSKFRANKSVEVPGLSRQLFKQLKQKQEKGPAYTLSAAARLAGISTKKNVFFGLEEKTLAATVAYEYAKGKQKEANLYKLKKFIDDTPKKFKLQGNAVWWGQIVDTEEKIVEMLAASPDSYKNFKADWDSKRGQLNSVENVQQWANDMGLSGKIDEDAFNDLNLKAEADASEEVPLDLKDAEMKPPYSVAEWSQANRLDARIKIGDKTILVDTTERKLQDVRFGPHHGSGKEAYKQTEESYKDVQKNKSKIRQDVATYFETQAFKELNSEIKKMKKRALRRKGVDKRNIKSKDLIKTYDKGSRGKPSTSASAYYKRATKDMTKEEAKNAFALSQTQFIFHSIGNEADRVRRGFRNVFRVSERQPTTGAAYYASVPTKMFGRNHARRFEFDEAEAKGTAIIRGASGVHAIMVSEKANYVGLQGKHANTQYKMYSTMNAGHNDDILKKNGIASSGMNSLSNAGFVRTVVSFSPKRMNKFLKAIETGITEQWLKEAKAKKKDFTRHAKRIDSKGIFWAMPYIGVDVEQKRTN